MRALTKVFTNRRGWVVLVPLIVAGAALLGVNIPEESLMGIGEHVTEAVMGSLAIWSLFSPKEES